MDLLSDLALDVRYVRLVSAYASRIALWHRQRFNVADCFEAVVHANLAKTAIRFYTLEITFTALNTTANGIAGWALVHRGISPGSTVALAMHNAPRFIEIFLGLCKIGVSVAMINTSLPPPQMRHCLAIVEPSYIICDAGLFDTVQSACKEDARLRDVGIAVCDPEYMSLGGVAALPAAGAAATTTLPCGCYASSRSGSSACDLPRSLAARGAASSSHPSSPDADCASYRALRIAHLTQPLLAIVCYIFTSGTTGLPKAAGITHVRYLTGATLLSAVAGVEPSDTIFTCLPLFHSAGLIVGTGSALCRGATLALSPRFRASTLWAEVVESRATAMQYLGETCRFLLLTPRHPDERRHALRLAFGNGLRPDVWAQFQERFAIPSISEFYASTEGATSMVSTCHMESGADGVLRVPPREIGVVGRFGLLVRTLVKPVLLLKYDVDSDELVRDERGWCVECGDGEPGELCAKLLIPPTTTTTTTTAAAAAAPSDGGAPQSSTSTVNTAGAPPAALAQRYASYLRDDAAMARRLARNVFRTGDVYYRSGDLLRREGGRFYFVDRLGETFRFKGENVATTEVAEVASRHPQVDVAIVFGVAVPGVDGRVGMAALYLHPPQVDLAPAGATTAAASATPPRNVAAAAAAAQGFDTAGFGDLMRSTLAPFAIPHFLRVLSAPPPTTATHKHVKSGYAEAGADPAHVPPCDKLFVWLRQREDVATGDGAAAADALLTPSAVQSHSSGRSGGKPTTVDNSLHAYVPLTREMWVAIVEGRVRL